jgi:prepilin-type N-terminal cleavage/methylation domain-containing protein
MTARPRRSGYTLLEMTLVTAIITIAGTLVIPSLEGMYGYYKKNGAVDAVKAAWAQARSQAIEEGRPYRFTALSGTGRFRVAPDQTDSGSAAVVEGSLPEGVTFGGASAADGSGEPIVFLPDGTARDDADVVFQVPGTRGTALHLRALTGAVTVRAADSPKS